MVIAASHRKARSFREFVRRKVCSEPMYGKEPDAYEFAFTRAEERPLYVHGGTGIRVWADVVDLASRVDRTEPAEPCAVCFVYCSAETFRAVTGEKGARCPNRVWDGLLERGVLVPSGAGGRPPSGAGDSDVSGGDALGRTDGAWYSRATDMEPEQLAQEAMRRGIKWRDPKSPSPGQLVLLERINSASGDEDDGPSSAGAGEEVGYCIPVFLPARRVRPKEGGTVDLADAWPPDPAGGRADWATRLVDAASTQSQRSGEATVARCLRAERVGVNVTDARGWSALHALGDCLHNKAFKREKPPLQSLQALLADPKVKPELRTKRGLTPLDLAEKRGYDCAAAVLREALEQREIANLERIVCAGVRQPQYLRDRMRDEMRGTR